MTDFVPNYEELVPPPARVQIDFYQPSVGHISVAPLGFKHHDDPSIVGTLLEGADRQLTYVHEGDAIITYPGNVVFRKPASEVSAFYRALPPAKPALPESIPEVDIEELLKESE